VVFIASGSKNRAFITKTIGVRITLYQFKRPGQKAIITSGFSETGKVKEAQRLGAGEYIKKPYSIEEIGLAVKYELNGHPPRAV
jgi:DNA-binding NarL/FixJ family response regulator